jgi:hypothetical protein
LIALILFHYFSKIIFNEKNTFPLQKKSGVGLGSASSNNTSTIMDSKSKLHSKLKRVNSQIHLQSEKGINQIFNIIYSRLFQQLDISMLNENIEEFKPTFLDKIQVTRISSNNQFNIHSLHCQESEDKTKTILQFRLDYLKESENGLTIELSIRPRVLPIDLKCILNDISFSSLLEVEMTYSSTTFGMSEITVYFKELPEFDYNIQMFESFDLNSMPSLNLTLRKYINDFLRVLIFPNKIPILKMNRRKELPDNLFDHFSVGEDILFECEDEIKNLILNVNEMLKKKLTSGKNKKVAKSEIFMSVLNFVKFGMESDKIPFSMIEMVQQSFQILNDLIFEDENKLAKDLLDILMEEENIRFISYVVQ